MFVKINVNISPTTHERKNLQVRISEILLLYTFISCLVTHNQTNLYPSCRFV